MCVYHRGTRSYIKCDGQNQLLITRDYFHYVYNNTTAAIIIMYVFCFLNTVHVPNLKTFSKP